VVVVADRERLRQRPLERYVGLREVPSGSLIAAGSEKPRTPGIAPK